MRKLRAFTLLIAIILISLSTVVPASGNVTCYTTWDENYFYAAFQVQDPDITGTNTSPFSKPWEDDSVEFYLETDNKHNPGRSKTSFHMAVSAAGGSAFTIGSDAGTATQKQIFSFKYSITKDGSLNNSEDQDVGYMVEMALPWFELGIDPPTPGAMMSFNAVIRMRGDTESFVSLSPEVKTEQDINDASKWSNVVFTNAAFGAATMSREKVVSARYMTRVPLIDGQIISKEWNKNTSFDLEMPITAVNRPNNQLQKTLLTYYFYWYQGDPRKAAPFSHVRASDGKSELTDQPIKSAGPWFSYDRVKWHKEELTDIKRAGIDIILPVYRGDPGNKAGFAAKGLDCMVEAIGELEAGKSPYPLVGMFFDTAAMQAAYGEKPDLRDEEVKRTFYGMVHDFFLRIPQEYRAQVWLGGRPCYIIGLSTSSWFSDFDSTFIQYVNERFAKDFGANLAWIGATDYKDKAPGFDGYCNYGAGLGFSYDDTSKIKIATVSRQNDDTYTADWVKALEKKPNWIMLDGWNDLHEGSELCGSRQYGYTYVDATAMQSLKFRGVREYDAKYLRSNLPEQTAPGTICQADVTVQNEGTKPWRAAEGYALAYRWYKDGAPVDEGGVKIAIQSDVFPGRSAEIGLGIAAVGSKNKNLPDGDYELRFEMTRLADDKGFSSLGDEGFTVPIRIGQPKAAQAAYLSVDGPVMVRTATDYQFRVRVRNDGATVWKAGSAALGCKLYKMASYLHGGPNDLEEEVATAPMRVTFTKDVPTGQIADITITVNMKDTAGKPIQSWKQSDPWSYMLRFDIWDGGGWISASGARTCDRIIDVFDKDYGVNIIACDVPDTLDGGMTCDVKLVVRNMGPDPWTPDKHSFGYHWYYLDGIEAVWDGEKTPVKSVIKPGEPQVLYVKVTAPPCDGRYILAFDFADGDTWASTTEISRSGDLLTTEVTVKNGKSTVTPEKAQ